MFDAGSVNLGDGDSHDFHAGYSGQNYPPVAKAPPHQPERSARDFIVRAPQNWRGVLGAALPGKTEIVLRISGRDGAPAVAVLGGISANRIVADDEDEKGWWSDFVGRDCAIDLEKFRVIGLDFIAGDGETPLDLTPADQASLFAHALSEAGIEKLHAFVGASFGGMVALSFARQFPQRLDKLIAVSAAHRPSPLAQAWRTVQRQILSFAIENGKPEEGVALARSLAMTTYRTANEFNQRFACKESADGGVADYLNARGDAYVEQTTAARYLTLSGAIDHHFEKPEDIATPALLIAIDTDQIVPLSDIKDLNARLAGESSLVKVSSLYGHDAFLKETAAIGPHIRQFISEA